MKKAAVIVGRFQMVQLQESQIQLIQTIEEQYDKLIIVLGLANQRSTANNPLDFQCRKAMLLEACPDWDIKYIKDHSSDEIWSEELDRQIAHWNRNYETTIYGSTEGFANRYKGALNYRKLDVDAYIAPSEILRQIEEKKLTGLNYRCGVFAAANDRHPTAFQTVDIAVFNEEEDKILLAQKSGEVRWRFIGGFSDPNSPNLEADARREVMEEANIEITDPVYIGSTKIDDSRYRGERDCIKTALFRAKYMYGKPQGGDDVAVVKWFDFENLKRADMIPSHWILLEMLKKND